MINNIEKENWTQSDIEDLIRNNAEESIYLEFKAAGSFGKDDVKRKDICKDVSAFANSDGGIIIYGIIEKDHKAESLSFIDGNVYTKEWLETIINSGIQRRIDGIRIHPVRFDNDITKSVYVVKIPVSPLAPHMTKENRYYRRYNFMSVPMEEYEVRHTYERKQNVKLDFGDIYTRIVNEDSWFDDKNLQVAITFHVKNIGNAVADLYKVQCLITGAEGYTFERDRDARYNFTSLREGMAFSNSVAIPIYPEEEIMVLNFIINIPMDKIFEARDKINLSASLFTQYETVISSFTIKESLNEFFSRSGIDVDKNDE